MTKMSKDNSNRGVCMYAFTLNFMLPDHPIANDPLPEPVAILKTAVFDWLAHTLDCQEFWFSWECTTNLVCQTRNHHFQGCFKLKKNNRARLGTILGRLTLLLQHMHIRPCSLKGLHKLPQYVCKPETHIAGPWSHENNVDLTALTQLVPPEKWYPVQHWLQSLYDQKPDSRKIIWIFDAQGCKGKSAWALWLAASRPNDVTYFNWINAKDGTAQIATAPAKKAYIFDLERNCPAVDKGEFYALLEQLKNGYVISTKYMGARLLMPVPHVFVLANFDCPRRFFSINRFMHFDLSEPKKPWSTADTLDDSEVVY